MIIVEYSSVIQYILVIGDLIKIVSMRELKSDVLLKRKGKIKIIGGIEESQGKDWCEESQKSKAHLRWKFTKNKLCL